MNKRIISVLLMLVMVSSLVFVGCKKEDATVKDTAQMTEEERDAFILETMTEKNSKVLTEEGLIEEGYILENEESDGPTGTIKLMSTDKFDLYVNFKDSNFVLEDLDSGVTYTSFSEDTNHNPTNTDILRLEVYDNTNKKYEFTTSEHCVQDPKAFKIVRLDEDTLRFIYTIGNDSDKELVPPVLSEDTYFKIIDTIQKKADEETDEKAKNELLFKIDDLHNLYKKLDPKNLSLEDKEKLQDQFPMITVKTMYVVRGLTEKQKFLVREAMIAGDFTVSDLKKELNDVEYSGKARAVLFTVPLDITLTDKGLKVNVDTSLIICPPNQKLYGIEVLPFFGSFVPEGASAGYMIVPDGSGTLIDVSGNHTQDPYSARVYGADETFNQELILSKVEDAVAGFYIFDRSERGGYLTTIDSGASMSFLNAAPVGSSNRAEAGVARAYYQVIYRERDFSSYDIEEQKEDTGGGTIGGEEEGKEHSTAAEVGTGVVTAKDIPTTVFEINYRFNVYEGDIVSPSYSWYANEYRNYLIANKKLPEKKLPADTKTPFYLELLGSVNKTESKAGIPVNSQKALTSYKDAQAIVNKLYEAGIPGQALKLRYTYWSNGGYENTAYTKLDLLGVLGSKSELLELCDTLTSKGSQFFPSADFMYVHKDVSGDGISYSSAAARNLSFSIARMNKRDPSTGLLSKDPETEKTLLSPEILVDMSESFKASYEKLFGSDLKTIALVGMGSKLNSSYKTDASFTRDLSLQEHLKAFETYKDYKILIDHGNDYAWKYASDIMNIPMGSSELLSSRGSIPFMQMLLHGYVNYAGSAFNVEADYSTSVLRAIETGSGINFKWMAAENSIFQNTPFIDFYSLHYEDTFNEAIKAYKAVSEFCDLVQGQLIVAHEEPESYIESPYIGELYNEDGMSNIKLTPTENVFMTTFENGVQVVVNYNGYNIELADRQSIEANSYIYRMDESSEWLIPQNFKTQEGGNN